MGVARRKVLMLHGHAQNADIFRNRTANIVKACSGSDIEFVYVNAPHILWPTDLPPARSSVGEARVNDVSYSEESTSAPRAWWFMTEARTKCHGIAKGIRAIRDILAQDEYEGVFGFSQGAAMAATISAILERPYLHPEFMSNGKPIHPRFRFCVAVSGFIPPCDLSDIIFSTSYNTPSVHVVGKNDVVVREEDTQVLLNKSAAKVVEYHVGGHFVPITQKWRSFFAEHLQHPEVLIPSPAASSPASSSTALDSDGTSSPASSVTDLDLAPGDIVLEEEKIADVEIKVEPAAVPTKTEVPTFASDLELPKLPGRNFGELKFPTVAQFKPQRPVVRVNTVPKYPYYAFPSFRLPDGITHSPLTAAPSVTVSVADLQRQVSELQIFTNYYWHFIFIASFFLPHSWRLVFILPMLLWVYGRRVMRWRV
ncbi:hypothetical protein GLOTRDRAFT_140197 [Gloeophyllum trabeum ATCC 11539]|uniref:Serine hydrolase domain-containing protein n=1 Tax=Gloeophyllum trabeum (strain ATCC 11539 / FP-39264 / Madison 617) TaxID=670483 RepID=S7PYP2_GLOTA|nr:uncharacterized protein GLOTRDRAFT_140197 [Gloeophyllum trabeum ATCC 11539]EPQ52447.1 hypothetical protein GLOTRDRAFT_140197 [Gloeophyllum trabeum ATCC 11539]